MDYLFSAELGLKWNNYKRGEGGGSLVTLPSAGSNPLRPGDGEAGEGGLLTPRRAAEARLPGSFARR